MKGKATEELPAEPALTIEELAAKLNVKPWQLEGLKAAYGWGAGKRLTESEFREKLTAWLSGPTAR